MYVCTYRDAQCEQFGNVSCASELYYVGVPQVYCIFLFLQYIFCLPSTLQNVLWPDLRSTHEQTDKDFFKTPPMINYRLGVFFFCRYHAQNWHYIGEAIPWRSGSSKLYCSQYQNSLAHPIVFHKLLLGKRATETEPRDHTNYPIRLQMVHEPETNPSWTMTL